MHHDPLSWERAINLSILASGTEQTNDSTNWERPCGTNGVESNEAAGSTLGGAFRRTTQGHAPPPVESMESSQSVNPDYFDFSRGAEGVMKITTPLGKSPAWWSCALSCVCMSAVCVCCVCLSVRDDRRRDARMCLISRLGMRGISCKHFSLQRAPHTTRASRGRSRSSRPLFRCTLGVDWASLRCSSSPRSGPPGSTLCR